MTSSGRQAIDLTDPAVFVEHDPHSYWQWRRQHAPIVWHERPGGPGFWSVTRHRDVLACYRDAARLGSARGTVLDVLLAGGDSAGGRMLAVSDSPRHRELRQVMLRAFSPRVLGQVEQHVTARADQLVRRIVGSGEVDFAAEVAENLPINTICDLLELPQADRPQLLAWNKSALSSDAAGGDPLDALEARNEILCYLADVVRERRARPGADVISHVAAATVAGATLGEDDIALNCYSLILGGDESTRVSLLSAVHALAGHDVEWQRLRGGDAHVRTAVEEVLRWSTPAMHFARTATTDLEIAGTAIAAGDIVTLWNTSANDDTEVFHDPRRFDVSRDPNPHLALGHGPHFCVGAFLGRTELGAVLRSLVRHVKRIEVLAEPPRIYSNFLNGFSAMPVALS